MTDKVSIEENIRIHSNENWEMFSDFKVSVILMDAMVLCGRGGISIRW